MSVSSEITDEATMKTNEEDATEKQNDKPEAINQCIAARSICNLKPKIKYNCLLVGILVLYGLVGGFVFKIFETASVGKETVKASQSTVEFLSELLKDHNKNSELFDENWRRSAAAKLDEFVNTKTIYEQVEVPVQWSFADSWLFACTIFTTIGRLFCMLFAAIGIPLFSVVAGSLASFMTDLTRTLHAEYHRRKIRAKAAQHKKDDSTSPLTEDEIPKLEITLKHVAVVCFGYLCLGSVFFSLGEGWSLFESFYYCFITLSTVGLGDYVPGNVHHTSLFGVYILVGLVLVIMLFGTLEEVITKQCQKIKDKLKVVD